jgi:predicted AAA+ superfamily ATPase
MDPLLARAASRRLDSLLRAMPVVVVTGPRQVGKSSLVRNTPALTNHRLIDLDDTPTRIAAERDPDDLVRRWPRVIIDEVQRVPALLLAVKAAVDAERHATKGRFVLTDSANVLAMHQVVDSLAGRAGYLAMAPMTRGELLGFGTSGRWGELWREPFSRWQDSLASNDAIPADWRELARRGGFPVPALHLDEDARHEWFLSYAATYLERDLRAVSAVDSLGEFQRAMRAFAIRAGTPVNHADVARELGLVARTLRRWLDLLVITGQVIEVGAWTVRRSTRLRRRPKFYWNDAALAMHVAGVTRPDGVHLETIVLNDLRTWASDDPERPTLHYWRDDADREVDFVIERGDNVLAVEVKATTKPVPDDWKHLKHFVREYEDRCAGALLLHGGDETFRASDRVLVTPWWRVL